MCRLLNVLYNIVLQLLTYFLGHFLLPALALCSSHHVDGSVDEASSDSHVLLHHTAGGESRGAWQGREGWGDLDHSFLTFSIPPFPFISINLATCTYSETYLKDHL